MAIEEPCNKKRVRDESDEVGLDLPEVKRIKEDLLEILDDSDSDPAIQDLDSVMKSFEYEISATASDASPMPVIDLTSETADSQPELAHLLEASDDELGLPPTSISSSSEGIKEDEVVRRDSVEIGGLWGFEDQIPSYDSFGLAVDDNYDNTGFVDFDDGLFEYSNVCFDSSEYSDFSYRLGIAPTE
ncbi:hypothetical protein K2173_017061 [Erythroxylum novogranatense]|uniref:Uncharacterized protein n=1 Tax=Erythroxylum novogranatense TaxID=1862640 RepID=A0AAV8U9I3_9ROSI|nr:hypothetical protein K2173_017061 [Erythroxylum novogranatense]